MELLFGRFPHLVEDIFGLLKAETLFCCSQINKSWNENLEDYRIRLVKKIQRHLKDPSIVHGRTPNFEQYEGQFLLRRLLKNMSISEKPTHGPTSIWGPPKALKRIITIDQLPLPFLVHFLRYFCDHRIKDCEVNFRITYITQTSSCAITLNYCTYTNHVGVSPWALYCVVDTSYGLGRSLGNCRPALPKGRKYQMVKTQTQSHVRRPVV